MPYYYLAGYLISVRVVVLWLARHFAEARKASVSDEACRACCLVTC